MSKYAAYYVFLPTIVSDFMTYSFCRLDDWTWGNKDAMVAKGAGGPEVRGSDHGGGGRAARCRCFRAPP